MYGTVCLDRFVLPGQSEEEAAEFPGGEAFNTATALAGWGVPVTLTGTAIGDDPEGRRLRDLLHTHPLARGIDVSLVPFLPDAVTPSCTIRVDENGERFMSGRGFREAVAPKLDTIIPRFRGRPLFTVDPNLGDAAIEATLAAARAGCKIVSMDCAASPEILAVSRVAVTSNEWVARDGSIATVEDAAQRMSDAGAGTAIVTQGSHGGVSVTKREFGGMSGLVTGDVRYAFAAAILPPKYAIADTTGAGDTFRAGLCYIQSTGNSIAPTLRFAAAAAALHCTIVGGGSRFTEEIVRNLASSVRVTRKTTG